MELVIILATYHNDLVSPKFPESTVAGLYKRAVAENHYQDAVRFGAQKINWTLKEFDVTSCRIINLSIEVFFSFRFRPLGKRLCPWR